jgi:hypothetical protein
VLPGLNPTVSYIDLRETQPSELAKLLTEKISACADDVMRVRPSQPVSSVRSVEREVIRTPALRQTNRPNVHQSGIVPKTDGCAKVATHVLVAFGSGAAFVIFMFAFSGPRRVGQQMLYNTIHFSEEWTPSLQGLLAWFLITATVIAVDLFLVSRGFDVAAHIVTFFGMVLAFTAWNVVTYLYFPDSPIGAIIWPLTGKTLGASLTTSVAIIVLIRRRAARGVAERGRLTRGST